QQEQVLGAVLQQDADVEGTLSPHGCQERRPPARLLDHLPPGPPLVLEQEPRMIVLGPGQQQVGDRHGWRRLRRLPVTGRRCHIGSLAPLAHRGATAGTRSLPIRPTCANQAARVSTGRVAVYSSVTPTSRRRSARSTRPPSKRRPPRANMIPSGAWRPTAAAWSRA